MNTEIYLYFNGNCEEAFEFYKKVLGGTYASRMHFRDMPASEDWQASEEDLDKIMHITLDFGNGNLIMGSDLPKEQKSHFKQGNNFSISLNPGTKAKADEVFAQMTEGGTITMPMADAFWGSYFGMFTDRFGINWMINVLNEDG